MTRLTPSIVSVLVAITVIGGASRPALAGLMPPLASYRAIYDLSLDNSKSGGDVGGLSGRLVTEFKGSRCAGYNARLRFVTELENADGGTNLTDSRSTTFETGDGSQFTFTNETYSNDNLIEESKGTARRAGKDLAVTLTRPGKKSFALPAMTTFPTNQVEGMLAAARRGERFYATDIYDGSESGETLFATATVIGHVSTANDDFGDETTVREAGIAGLRHWPVTVSYFDKSKTGDDAPFYTMSFVVYDNGIGRKLKIDYGDFAITARLTSLEILPSVSCR